VCVAGNYKFFYLFLLYLELACFFIVAMTLFETFDAETTNTISLHGMIAGRQPPLASITTLDLARRRRGVHWHYSLIALILCAAASLGVGFMLAMHTHLIFTNERCWLRACLY
jgi:hypothetical protein